MKNLKSSFLLFALALGAVSAWGQTNSVYAWRNFVGQPGGQGNADGAGSAARFMNPYGVAVDSAGNVYVADTGNHTIRKVTSAGVVTTLAGLAGSSGTNDGTGSAARFYQPEGVAVDSAGNVYVADTYNHTIRKVTSAGVVTTLAGLAGQYGSADDTGSAARFRGPSGVAVDSASNVYVADTYNHTIRKVTSAGVVTTLAGLAGSSGTNDGTGSAARFYQPEGVAVDSAGNVYVADTGNYTIRKVTSDGVVTTLAGWAGQWGSADGTGSAARFRGPSGVAVDSTGSVYVADTYNYTIRKVTSAGLVTTMAGLAGQSGSADGTGGAARFYQPYGVAVDSAGNVYVADSEQLGGSSGNNTIRKVTSAGVVTTLVGLAGQSGSADGTGSAARFFYPSGIAVNSAGNLYVADTLNHTIRKVTSAGVVTTLAGFAGQPGSADGTGSAAGFYLPSGMAVDSAANVYVADTLNDTIRKVTSAGVVTTLAGLAGQYGSADGTGSAAQFFYPRGVAVDGAGNVYVADTGNYTIRKVTSAGVVTTLAGSARAIGTNDGTGSMARFYNPYSVVVDNASNVYVADSGNCTIRKVTSAGVVTTLAGLAGQHGSADGTGSVARFSGPTGMAMDSAGNIYVADNGNHSIRKLTPVGTNWVVRTIGGKAGVASSADGVGTSAIFSYPQGLAVDTAGYLYVADTRNNRISKGMPIPTMTCWQSGGSLILSWPSPFAGFLLQTNANLGNPGGWADCGYSISDDGTNKSISVFSPAGTLFFRLRSN